MEGAVRRVFLFFEARRHLCALCLVASFQNTGPSSKSQDKRVQHMHILHRTWKLWFKIERMTKEGDDVGIPPNACNYESFAPMIRVIRQFGRRLK